MNKLKIIRRKIKNFISVLNKKEKIRFVAFLFANAFNSILDLFSTGLIIGIIMSLLKTNDSIDSLFLTVFEFIGVSILVTTNVKLILLFIVSSLKFVYQVWLSYAQEKFGYKIQNRVTKFLFKNTLNIDFKEYISFDSSKLIRILSQDSLLLNNYIISPLIILFSEIFLLFLFFIAILFYNSYSAIVFLLLLTFIIVLLYNSINLKIKKWGNLIKNSNTKRIKIIQDTFSLIDLIKIYSNSSYFTNEYNSESNQITSTQVKYTFTQKLPKNLFEYFFSLSILILVYLSGIIDSINSLIVYVSFFALFILKAIPSLNKISAALQSLFYSNSFFEDILKLLKLNGSIRSSKEPIEFGEIEFKNISFSYSKKNIFSNTTLTINKGDYIGILGESGSGKSTLLKIISGLLIPSKGGLFIDQQKINFEELSNYVSYVNQETFVLDKDIYTNISFPKHDEIIDEKLVKFLIQKVSLESLDSKGDQYSLGENGHKISVGQKQRIGIARALYKKRSIIVFDESTSSLDSFNEEKILDLIDSLRKEKTIIFVSHKLDSLNRCSRILKVRNNQITENE